MARSPQFRDYSEDVLERYAALGKRIRSARIRRRLRQQDLADKATLSLSTIKSVESGALETSLGAYAKVLWVLGLDREVDLIGDPGLDREGLAYSTLEKRVFVRRKVDNDF